MIGTVRRKSNVEKNKMRILITGAGGFLGRELLRQLKENTKVQVVALTSQQNELKEIYQNSSNITIVDRDALFDKEHPVEKVDVLINCAFPRNVDGVKMAEGMLYIQRVLESARDMQVRAVVNISSQSVYSQMRENAASEDTVLDLESKYAVGKYATELLTNSICKEIPHTSLRMASLIGPEFDQRLTNKMVKAAFKNRKILIQEDHQKFGFLDVEDAARGVVAVIFSAPEKWSECYNLGTNQAYSLRNIAECIARAYAVVNAGELEIESHPAEDSRNTALDCQKIKEEIGFEAEISLQESIDKIMENTIAQAGGNQDA